MTKQGRTNRACWLHAWKTRVSSELGVGIGLFVWSRSKTRGSPRIPAGSCLSHACCFIFSAFLLASWGRRAEGWFPPCPSLSLPLSLPLSPCLPASLPLCLSASLPLCLTASMHPSKHLPASVKIPLCLSAGNASLPLSKYPALPYFAFVWNVPGSVCSDLTHWNLSLTRSRGLVALHGV